MLPAMSHIGRAPIEAIEAARRRIEGAAIRTPLLPLASRDGDNGIWLKLECLQPIGSFKIRGAANAMALAEPGALSRGVYTASAGNMAQGVAYAARRLGVPCRVIMPDAAPRAKVDAVRRLGGDIVKLPFDEWWKVLQAHGHPDEPGLFIHPVSDPAVIAGNGTIGLELMEDLDDIDTVMVPYGGGGLSCGIASALAARSPDTSVFACEVATAAPFRASLDGGAPVAIRRTESFVDGIGASGVLEDMWPLASLLLAGSSVVSLEEVRGAVRSLALEAHVVAEGAGASSVAAARRRASDHPEERIVAVVSGGNIDADVLAEILGDDRA